MSGARPWHIMSGPVGNTEPGIAWDAEQSGDGYEAIVYFKDRPALGRFAHRRRYSRGNRPWTIQQAVARFIRSVGWYATSPLGDGARPGFLLIEYGVRDERGRKRPPRVVETWLRQHGTWREVRKAVVAPRLPWP